MTNAWLPPEQYIETIARATSYACLYFTDTAGRPFQLRSRNGVEVWQWPGGNMELGETPWECARRECLEETGIDFRGPQRLLGVHFVPQRTTWPVNHIGFIFDGGVLTDDRLAQVHITNEHTAWRVATIDEWRRDMSTVNFARLQAISAARETGIVAYLERH
ncbi:NUDIX domain-containing protein [Streptomyces carpinensis]|uniref:NUDIX hydrolase n=1 Tax=Streptomyces carpinensis TaxID=66369 RepID=A0ABV1W279_9ACTN|nr:NUDIX hydrolase [Streptomyces carpinensis]